MAMERTRIAKVDDVTLSRRGEQVKGALHLTPHHIIFVHTPFPSKSSSTTPNGKPPRPRELWITYPIIQQCTLRTSPTASRQPSCVRLRCRDFTFACFYFIDDRKARDVYDSVRAWTCKLSGIERLYAFTYQPQGPEKDVNPNGWSLYDPVRELRRMGVGDESKKSAWRISTINNDYAFAETYPAVLAVPASISDNTLNYAGRYRSRARIPVLTYLHPVNDCSITRCSQPLVGVRGNRSIQDEKLVAAIFNTTRAERPLSAYSSPPPEREESRSSKETSSSITLEGDLPQTADAEAIENAVMKKLRGDDELSSGSDEKRPVVYGAQQRNMIVDARPTVNALAMQAVGMGSEDMSNYKFASKVYLGIDNIHVMRDSLQKVVDTLKDSDLTPLGPNREQLQKSNWLKHVASVLDGAGLIARQVGLQHSHVMIHCSDGWDRTSQLSALSQICLDPYYRTIEGFIVLVEKDWLSFGHMFKHRSGFLNSEKWFQIENERVGRGNEDVDGKEQSGGAMAGAQKTFENALLSAKGFFSNTKFNESRESVNVDSDVDADSESQAGRRIVSGSVKKDKEKMITKVKETAPIFHQFLDATYQLLYQYPTRFEFTERFLRRLLYHLYSCQYGTFLLDSEKERKQARLSERTRSVWDYFMSRKKEFSNPRYDPVVDDNVRGKERLIFPRIEEVRWWNELFGRTDDEMNGKPLPPLPPPPSEAQINGLSDVEHIDTELWTPIQTSVSSPVSRVRTPVNFGVETNEESTGWNSSPRLYDPVLRIQSPVSSIGAGMSSSGSPKPKDPISRTRTPVMARPDPKPVAAQDETLFARLESAAKVDESNGSREDTTVTELSPANPDRVMTHIPENSLDSLSEDLDPLGISEVKDHVSQSKRAQTAMERRREHMEMLMK
ncbi:uncharacterized protein Z518_07952 [Rhinocladiella mackenziei CBS 650.93]|uniref:Myotubularin phosphatase domain-containing protein n=1 Tax=Rhinocladiella mackenziei CBS 650.93 TaxID=1442369 RepID=A0A0D2GUT7_9EURO|nr:uncharacterized protein Z518_07952 [Rhinocladiella mackenziei CBS 650.93]KIX02013.1 hypothetical protein Z518_07952 [Rhinocladiella mackenziei CBS 650.93]